MDIEIEDSAIPYAGKLEGLSIGDIVTVQGLVHPECESVWTDGHPLVSAPPHGLKVDRADERSVRGKGVVSYRLIFCVLKVQEYIVTNSSKVAEPETGGAVNLYCMKIKDEPNPDIAFHFNPRLSQRYVVRNSKLGGRWDKEETAACFPFPFKRGEAFTIDIFVADGAFYCQVNSAHFCTFQFRTSFERITELQVRGTGVSVGVVRRGTARSYPARAISDPQPPIVPKNSDDTPIEWGNPAIGILPEGLQRGRQLVILGRIKLLPHSFYINLQSSVQMWPHPDIPLHINPRFMTARKHVVIRNSWQLGSWGNEERMETSHLSPGTKFELKINVEDDHYSLWADNNLIGIFKFRMSADCVNAVVVQGDVQIYRIYQQDIGNNAIILCDDF